MCKRIHRVCDQTVQIYIWVLKDLRCDGTEFHTQLMFNSMPKGNRAIGTSGGDQLKHNRLQNMIWRYKLIECIGSGGKNIGVLCKLQQGVFALEEFYKLVCRFKTIGISIGMPPDDKAAAT